MEAREVVARKVEAQTQKRWRPKGGGPTEGGGAKVGEGALGGEARRVGGAAGWGPKGGEWGPEISLFLPAPTAMFVISFFRCLGDLFVELRPRLKDMDHWNCR